MRDKLQIINVADGVLNAVRQRLTVPSHLVRLAFFQFDFASHISGESISMRLQAMGFDIWLDSGPILGTTGKILWGHGLEINQPIQQSFNPATGIHTYFTPLTWNAPLLDTWLESDTTTDILFESVTNGETFSSMEWGREIKALTR